MVKRYIKPNQQQQQGGIVEKEAPLHISNVMPLDPEDGRPTRVGFRVVGGKKVRVSKRTGKVLNQAGYPATARKKADMHCRPFCCRLERRYFRRVSL